MTNDIDDLPILIPDLSSELLAQFREYYELISFYNTKLNLVSKSTVSHAADIHFADCYMGLRIIDTHTKIENRFYDFGSGNGFPGIIAAMMFPKAHAVLVERDQRKAEFLKSAANLLKLTNVEVYADSLAALPENSAQLAISRAMAPLPKFLLETRQVMALSAKAFIFKGGYWTTEFGACPPQILDYWNVDLVGSYTLPKEAKERFIVLCERADNTHS